MWSESCRVLNPVRAIMDSKSCEYKDEDNQNAEKTEKKSLRDRIVDWLNKIEIKWMVK